MSTYEELLNEYTKLKEDYDEHKRVAIEYEKELEDTNRDYEIRNGELIEANEKVMKEINKLKEDYLQYKEKNLEKMKEIEFLENQGEKLKQNLESSKNERVNLEKKIIFLENENNDYLNKARELECWADELKNKLDAALEENIILHNENEATKSEMEEAMQRLQEELEETKHEITSKEKIINRMTMHRDFLLKTAYNVQDDLNNNIISSKSLHSLKNSSSGKLQVVTPVNKNMKIPEKFMQTYSKSFLNIEAEEEEREKNEQQEILDNIEKEEKILNSKFENINVNDDRISINQENDLNDGNDIEGLSSNGIALNMLNEDDSRNNSKLDINGLNINLTHPGEKNHQQFANNLKITESREDLNISQIDRQSFVLNKLDSLAPDEEADQQRNHRFKKPNSVEGGDNLNPDNDNQGENPLLNTTGLEGTRSKKISVHGLEKYLKGDLKGSIVINDGDNLCIGNEDDEEREFIRQRIDMEINTILDTRKNFLLNTLTQENFSFDLVNLNAMSNLSKQITFVDKKTASTNTSSKNFIKEREANNSVCVDSGSGHDNLIPGIGKPKISFTNPLRNQKLVENIDEMLAKIHARKEKVLLQKKAMQTKLERVGIKIC
jgi:hypothetical protein